MRAIAIRVSVLAFAVLSKTSSAADSISDSRDSILDDSLPSNNDVSRHLRPTSTAQSMVSDAPERRKLDSCSTGEMLVEIDLVTDQYPNQTSWKLSDSSGKTIKAWKYGDNGMDDMKPNDAWLDTVGCIAENECYTFAIFDSAGNGMVSDDTDEYYNGSYRVYVNPDPAFNAGLVVESGDAAFGSSISHTFGTCVAMAAEEEESCAEGTLPVTLDFVFDDGDGEDVSLYLIDLDAEEFVWNEKGLSGNATVHHYFACLNSSNCANLVFPNWRPSDVNVTYNGKNKFVPIPKKSGTVVTYNC